MNAPVIEAHERVQPSSRPVAAWKMEAFGAALLLVLVGYFLGISWRKWPDPLVDSGPQLYATWQVSQGAHLYHDFLWNYGPFSVCFNAALFKIFGAGLMVLVTANLVFYAAILTLLYIAFRKAWGRLAAFAATAVFISVFSFSHLLAVGNYNFVTPYAPEVSHGMLLILATAFVVVSCCRKPSANLSFLLGLCGGISAVMKPEFMLACGVLGIAALAMRWRQGLAVRALEWASIAAGVVLPTLAFTLWFARAETFKESFIDASQAWWLVLVGHIQNGDVQQSSFLGANRPWANVVRELDCAALALLVLGVIWGIGRLANFQWTKRARVYAIGGVMVVIFSLGITGEWRLVRDGFLYWNSGWINVGRCLAGLMLLITIWMFVRLRREFREKQLSERTLMAFALVLLADAMLARMSLYSRVFHFGFFQAALAAMVVVAVMVTELPRWTGRNLVGQRVATVSCLLLLALGCGTIAAKSNAIRLDQTEPVGSARDRFYSTKRSIDGTGALVNWASERLRSKPADAEVLVLPEGGTMINYLSRHKSPSNVVLRESEVKFVDELRRNPPEYVVLISRDLREFGVQRYGAPGNPGFALVPWVAENYQSEARLGGDPLDPDAHVGAVIMHRKAEEKIALNFPIRLKNQSHYDRMSSDYQSSRSPQLVNHTSEKQQHRERYPNKEWLKIDWRFVSRFFIDEPRRGERKDEKRHDHPAGKTDPRRAIPREVGSGAFPNPPMARMRREGFQGGVKHCRKQRGKGDDPQTMVRADLPASQNEPGDAARVQQHNDPEQRQRPRDLMKEQWPEVLGVKKRAERYAEPRANRQEDSRKERDDDGACNDILPGQGSRLSQQSRGERERDDDLGSERILHVELGMTVAPNLLAESRKNNSREPAGQFALFCPTAGLTALFWDVGGQQNAKAI